MIIIIIITLSQQCNRVCVCVPCFAPAVELTKTVAGVRHEHIGGGVHLVGGGEERLDDHVFDGPHQRARVDALALQVPQKGTQRPLVPLVIHLGVFVSGEG